MVSEILIEKECIATVRASPEKIATPYVTRPTSIDLSQKTRKDTADLISYILGSSGAQILGHGGVRMAVENLQHPGYANKFDNHPRLVRCADPWDHTRKCTFDKQMREGFPEEWLLPEHHEKHDMMDKKDGTQWILLVDSQKNLHSVHANYASAPTWCYGNAEGSTAEESEHSDSVTIQQRPGDHASSLIMPSSHHRERYLRVTRQLLGKNSGESFDEEEFLSVQGSSYLRDLFHRVDTDALFREKFTDFIDAVTIFAQKTGEIVDGMGKGNVSFRKDKTWDPLIIDAMAPGPPHTLHLARSVLEHYPQTRHDILKNKEHIFDQPRVVVDHAVNFCRSLTACRRKAGLNPEDDIRLLDNSLPDHLDLVHDDLFFATQHWRNISREVP